ncbi:MAG: 50S ribosomal protein L22 [Actinobacteria bacterium]|nr:50S ribosomal protein L22 [Actinomycetota bacterium]
MSAERFSYAKTGLVRAEAKHVRSSARKARLVLADIRGRNVLDARKQLLFSPRAVAKDIELVLRSAVTNAEVNHGLSPDDLVIHEAFANEGVTIKRFKPRARGRASRINKRTTHITILLRSLTSGAIVDGTETAAPAAKASSDSARAKRVAASKQAEANVETGAAEVAESTDEKPAAKKPAAKKPAAKKPAAKKTEAAAADATTEKKPAAKKPAAKKPAAAKADDATATKPAAKKPAAKKPAAPKKPAAEKTDEEKS